MPHTDHHAILVGIASYPRLGEGNSRADLQGPRNDVAAIRKWLLDPDGGDFASAETIHEVQAPADAQGVPTASQLDNLIARLHELAMANPRRQVGRRIYIYMSGHGFSPGRQRACLFTADAQEHNAQNVHATGWLNWLQDSGYFREFVLWVDACMNRAVFFAPHDPPLPPVPSSVTPLASFCAFAAQRPLKAVELPIAQDEGKVHGAFTWALLEGLRGAAADVNGRVTGRSLADWLRNAMSSRYGKAERENRDISQEPEIVSEDAGLIFVRGIAPPEHQVTLAFPPAAGGAVARVWSGTPPRVVHEAAVPAGGRLQVSLRPGLYLVQAGPLRHGFEVLGATEVAVTEEGPAVVERRGGVVFRLQLEAKDPAAEIFVVDSRFSLVDRAVGHLDTPVPAGIFKVKMRVGNAINQQVMLVDRSDAPEPLAEQQLATVLPIEGTAATHESHVAAWDEALLAAQQVPCGPDESVLLCMTRTFSRRPIPVPGTTPPWKGLKVADAQGQVVIDMEADAQQRPGGDPLAFAIRRLPPGQYYLRQKVGAEGELEQGLVLSPGWRTEAYVLRRVIGEATDIDVRPRMAVMMRRPGEGPSGQQRQADRSVEVAKQALAAERRLLTPELADCLFGCGNPVAAILGGHLMVMEHEREPGSDLSRLDDVVRRLRAELGAGHPDVEALALHCTDPALRSPGALRGPPLFLRSWLLLAAAAHERPELLPAALWARTQALASLPPFLVWNAGDKARSAARDHLRQVLFEPLEAEPPAATRMPPPVSAGLVAPMASAMPAARALPASDAQRRSEARRRAARMGLPPSAVDALADSR